MRSTICQAVKMSCMAATGSWNDAAIFENFHARVYDEFFSCCYDLGGMSEAVAYFLR